MKKMCLFALVCILLVLAITPNILNVSAIIEDKLTENIEEVDESYENSSARSIPGGEEIEGEEWYYIEVNDNGIPINYQDIDYSETYGMLEFLKPGDIIYETNGSLIGDIVGHIGIVYDIVYDSNKEQDYVIMIEVLSDGVGYGLMTPNRFEEKNVIIYRLTNASESQIQGALSFMKNHLNDGFRFPNKKYAEGYKTIDENGNEITSWYCAELVWAAFYSEDINLDSNDNSNGDSLIAPAGLASYEHLTTILHYTDDEDEERYKTTITNNGATGHTYSCDGDTYTEEHDYEVYNYCYEKCRACGYERQAKEHDYSYTTASSSVHEATCTDCGYTETKSHNFVCDGVENYLHYEKCTDCGYRANRMSGYQYVNINSTQHTSECTTCGHTSMGEHKWGYQMINNTSHRKYCTSCGYIAGTESHVVDYTYTDPIGKYKRCKHCKGLYTSGVITPIIKNKIEIEEETE